MKALGRRFRRSKTAVRVTLTLYTRAGCHLCENAKKPVGRAVAATPGAVLRTVDIAADADLEARYGLRIPVVTAVIAGVEEVVAEGKISGIRLRRVLGTFAAED